jgi:hypothetical protein
MLFISLRHMLALRWKSTQLGEYFTIGRASTKKAPGSVACFRPSAPVEESLIYGSSAGLIGRPKVVDKDIEPTILLKVKPQIDLQRKLAY